MNGIIVINKPLGKTSHDMVYFVRRLTGIKKVGHTGTLDPSASGVLPVCVGNATKVCDLLTNADKMYRVSFVLGMTTDTLDADGEILTEQPVNLTETEIKDAVFSFLGNITQIPPMYSAVKVNGKKLYELARAGITVERKERHVTIKNIDILDIDIKNYIVTMDVECTKGTYIRTLCEDIGQKLGVGAYVNTLERRKSGVFTIEDSLTFDELLKLKEEGKLLEILRKPDSVFLDLPKVTVGKKQAGLVKNGVSIRVNGLLADSLYRVYSEDGEFLAVSHHMGGELKLQKPFWDR